MRKVTPVLKPDWLTREEVAAELRVSVRSVDRYIRQGRIAASQLVVGGTVRISASSMERLLERNKSEPCKVGEATSARF